MIPKEEKINISKNSKCSSCGKIHTIVSIDRKIPLRSPVLKTDKFTQIAVCPYTETTILIMPGPLKNRVTLPKDFFDKKE